MNKDIVKSLAVAGAIIALALAATWSLLAWEAHASVGWFGDFAAASADWVT